MSDITYTLDSINSSWTATDNATLVFVRQGHRVLLIRKKRGLGAGKINGPGGKLDPGETAEQCAVREVREELCITVFEPVCCGRLRFQFTDGYSIDVQVFIAEQFDGTPEETEEAIPLWFDIDAIPYDDMWADDRVWLPRVLAGDSVDGRFLFTEDTLIDHQVAFTRGLLA